jgi:polyferredoxin
MEFNYTDELIKQIEDNTRRYKRELMFENILKVIVIIGAITLVVAVLVGYVAFWMAGICWILAQFGYTFSGWSLLIPFWFVVAIHLILSVFERK